MTFAMDGESRRSDAPNTNMTPRGRWMAVAWIGLLTAGPNLALADAGPALPAIRTALTAATLSSAGQTAPENGEPQEMDRPDEPAAPPKEVPATGGAIKASVTPLETKVALKDAKVEEIRLVKDKSAVIRTNVPIARAQVANPTIADIPVVTPQEVVVTAQGFGVTQLTLWTTDDQRKTFDIVVEIDVPMLNRAIKQLSPQAAVEARMLSGTLVLAGRAPDSLTAERIEGLARIVHNRVTNHMDIAGVQQTLLRCTVAEVNKEAIRELSVNWAMGGGGISNDFFFANNLGGLNPINFGDSGVMNLIAPPDMGGALLFNRAPSVTGPNTNFTFGFPKAELQFFLRALRDNNLFRVLAEPNVVAVNGQEASFLSGGEFPIAVAQGGATAGAISIEFKQFGILLGFTPTVLGSGQVRMRVVAEVSDLVPSSVGVAGGLPVFSLSTRRVESTVESGDGQTFAIGGLISERVRAASSRIPGLGDVPILGALFSSVQYQRNETELVILVTPELVAPMDPHQVPPVPGDSQTEPDDFDLFALGKLEGDPHPTPQAGDAPRHGYPARVRPAPTPAAGDITLQGPFGVSDTEER